MNNSTPDGSPQIGLFDSNAHPDFSDSDGSGYQSYVEAARTSGFVGACAVGLPGTDPRQHMLRCRESGFLTPVAPWRSTGIRSQRRALRNLHELGYHALKVHPRWGGPAVGTREFRRLLQIATGFDMVVFLCTYPFGNARSRLGDRLLDDLDTALASTPDARIVLLHGGAVDLLRYIEFCRANDQLLLDLSHTLVKYPGSSLDDDIAFAVKHFDRRVCVGTDHPYYAIGDVVDRLAFFLRGLPEDKQQNVLRHSIENFLNPR
jgi:predicted TIM-barrel fold metal-dependent hydrolase